VANPLSSGNALIPPLQSHSIPLAQIDLDEATLEMAPPGSLERLKVSVMAVGLLNPVWLRLQPGAHWQVITGTRRLKVASDLGWQEISAHLLPAGTPDLSCWLVHLYDNAFSRGFNLWEQASLAARLREVCGPETVATQYLPYLGLPPSPAHLERLCKVASLGAPWRRLAVQGRLALTAGALLANWGPEDQEAARPFFENLSLSQSKQEELLDQVALLARREGCSPMAILARTELQQALADAEQTPQGKTALVRHHLFRWVHPRLRTAREAFTSALNRLGLNRAPRLRLHPPAAFEGPDFSLEIKFRDAPELQQLLADIARLARQEDFADLTRS
jgi:ParB family transcriptional regulator, chromosome partitioning protein